jgi:tetratricopeptide (TPR) repeat protein
MLRYLALLAAASAPFAAEQQVYELSGRLVPPMVGRISLFGATTPYSTTTLMDVSGRFHFKKLRPGLYTIAIFNRRRGEARRTVEIGPALADAKGRITIKLELKDADFVFASTLNRHLVSAKQLAVPGAALRDYQQAQKDLGRHDSDTATKRLEHAVELAPQFSEAWNSLGVISYQTRKYDRAEECFRKAVDADPAMFEAIVNLGGVALTLHQFNEAADYNLKAVLQRPNDALANAQLGMTYLAVSQLDLALKYLEQARRLDPTNMTYPQLSLFEIHLRRGERIAAAADLEDFLLHHPDAAEAGKMRQTIANLRAEAVER